MGFIKVIYLYCNGNTEDCICQNNESSEGDSPYENIGDYKKDMKREGWVFKKNNKAFCPGCVENLKI